MPGNDRGGIDKDEQHVPPPEFPYKCLLETAVDEVDIIRRRPEERARDGKGGGAIGKAEVGADSAFGAGGGVLV